MSLARIALAAGALAVASFGAGSAHAAVVACTAQVAGTNVCTDTGRPGCVWGNTPTVSFITVFC